MTAALRGGRLWGTVAWALLVAAAFGYVELASQSTSGLLRVALALIVLGGIAAAVLLFRRSRRLLATISAAAPPREARRPTERVERPSQRTTPPSVTPPSSPST
jgi:hypothetical protein